MSLSPMDDMNALRGLGRELEHEPPAGLARQRHRLLGSSDRRRRPRGWMFFGAVAAVTATALLVPAVLLSRYGGAVGGGAGLGRSGDDRDLNVLVLGSDGRGSEVGARADTMLIVHLPRDRRNVTVVSIPRDSLVRIPDCRSRDGRPVAGGTGVIGTAFAIGGMACAGKAVTELTGVRLDHTVEIDYTGFKSMVNALGGVQVTLPQAVKDPFSGLTLSKGRHVVTGDQALAYVRNRHGLGDGSDLSRIQRQQQFMAAMAAQAHLKTGDPAALLRFLNAVTTYVKPDKGLGLSQMVSILSSLKDTDTRHVRFVTVPWQPSRTDPARIEWRQPAADRLFAGLRPGS